MMKVFIVRHGQTEWNKTQRWQGNKDIPLDDAGALQASRLAEKISRYDIHRIYSSPLLRAAETAEAVRKSTGSELILNDELKEVRLGEWEGLTMDEIMVNHKELFTRWGSDPSADIGHGVENLSSLQERAYNALISLCSREDRDFLIVTHGAWIRGIVCKLLHIPVTARMGFELDNTGVSIVDYCEATGRLKVVSINDISHL